MTSRMQERTTLVNSRALLKPPMEERRKIMVRLARDMENYYKHGKLEDLETGEIAAC